MKHHIYFILMTLPVLGLFSCTKTETQKTPTSVNIFNAIPADDPIIPVFGTSDPLQYFNAALSIWYGSGYVYSPPPGEEELYIVKFNADTADPKRRLFDGKLNLERSSIYSLFLSGNGTKSDTLFTKDIIPFYTDSSAGVRFVNLLPDGPELSINLEGTPDHAEVTNLGYRDITAFKKYPVTSLGFYNFEIRDQATGEPIINCTWNYSLYRNYTIIIGGSAAQGSSFPVQAFIYNNF